MGSSATAYFRFGYVLPEREYPDNYDWDNEEDDDDIEGLWVRSYAPESVLSLALTQEETDEWNALPYYGSYGPDTRTPEQRDRHQYFRDKADKWYEARRAWLEENPYEVSVGADR